MNRKIECINDSVCRFKAISTTAPPTSNSAASVAPPHPPDRGRRMRPRLQRHGRLRQTLTPASRYSTRKPYLPARAAGPAACGNRADLGMSADWGIDGTGQHGSTKFALASARRGWVRENSTTLMVTSASRRAIAVQGRWRCCVN